MTLTLRIVLIIASTTSFILCIRKIKQSKMQVSDSIVWVTGSILLILMSLFSNIVEWIATKLGVISPENFVFLIITGFALIQVFIVNMKISKLEEKLKELNHYIALNEYKNNNRKD